ncbi:MAG: hypothetical protein HY223_03250 [Thaumarchaeota archaeon]|nr:hypothetical protein [Nitrososphaerota archaeon]
MLVETSDFLPQIRTFLEDGVDYIGIINKCGRLEDFASKEDIKLSAEKREMFCMGLRLLGSMQEDYDDEFGPVNYSMTERENSKILSIPAFSHTILAIINKDLDHTQVINKIRSMIGPNILAKYRKEKLS